MDTSNTSDTSQKRFLTRRKPLLLLMAGVFSIAALTCWIYWLGWGRYEESTEDAFVAGNIVQVMPQVAGTVSAIYIDDTHSVAAGQILVKLNDADAQLALQKAESALAQTVRQVKQYYENVEQAQAMLRLKQVNVEKTQSDFKRRLGLLKAHAISREEFQHAKALMSTAQSEYDLAQHRLAAELALVEHSHLYQHPLVEQAAALLKSAYLDLQRTVIRAPVGGYVTKRSAQLGQQIIPGTPLLAIVPLDQIWVDANYKESQLEQIHVGQVVTLTVDAYKHIGTYHGRVMGLSPGTGSAFALLPPQNASGNWIKIVQRLPVRIQLDPKEIKAHPLQLGLSVKATVHINSVKTTSPSQLPSYTTPLFDNQLGTVTELTHRIIQENAPDITVEEAPIASKQK